MPGGRRRLTQAEIELWISVAQSVQPREGAHLPAIAPPAPAKPAPPSREAKKEAAAPFLPPYVPPPQPRKPAEAPLAPFEKRYRRKITRGHVDIDGAIDLHGLTQSEAHAALRGFLRASAAQGARLVLVVTGKGLTGLAPGEERGVLRRAVPHWLRSADLRGLVLGFEEAAQPHGGLGALYVRLRRRDG